MQAVAPSLCNREVSMIDSSQSSRRLKILSEENQIVMQFHPVAELFPLMSADEFDALCSDIRENGLREAIWTHEDAIIDGRNRFNACIKTGKEPRYRAWDGVGSLTGFVVSLNLKRRHLSESQRAMVAQKLATWVSGDNQFKKLGEGSQICEPISQSVAAEMLNVSPRLVSSARKIVRDGVPEIAAMVESGEMQVSEAAEIVELPQGKQKRIIKRGRSARRKLLNSLKTRSLKAKSKAGCLLCDPQATATDETISGSMQILAEKFPKYARFFADVVEEIEQEKLSDDTRSNYDKVYAAIDAGMCEHNDCRRATGLGSDEFDLTISAMLDFEMIEVFYQGGKTETARGARKKLYRRREKQDVDDLTYEIDDDVDDDFGRYFEPC